MNHNHNNPWLGQIHNTLSQNKNPTFALYISDIHHRKTIVLTRETIKFTHYRFSDSSPEKPQNHIPSKSMTQITHNIETLTLSAQNIGFIWPIWMQDMYWFPSLSRTKTAIVVLTKSIIMPVGSHLTITSWCWSKILSKRQLSFQLKAVLLLAEKLTQVSYRWLSARLWYLQCISTGDTTVSH